MTAATSGTSGRPVPRPSSLEVLCSLLFGQDASGARLPPPPEGGFAAAVEQAMLPALQRTPCVVSFSGGRDSSAVLAVATAVARRHGLEEPVPVTMRFRAGPGTDEAQWQRLVLDHLGLRRHEILYADAEYDALGVPALRALRRHGVRWPVNAYMHDPVLRAAAGGTVLTGIGGDELLGHPASRVLRVLRGRSRPQPRDALRIAAVAAPRSLRRIVWRRRHRDYGPWLTAEGNALVMRALAREEIAFPERYDAAVRRWYGSRAFAALDGALGLLGEAYDARVVNPFLQPGALAALAAAGGAFGLGGRTNAMRRLFGDHLPEAVIARPTKAHFAAPMWGPRFRAFAETWDGSGVDPSLVDVDALRSQWNAPAPDFRTGLLLHQAAVSRFG